MTTKTHNSNNNNTTGINKTRNCALNENGSRVQTHTKSESSISYLQFQRQEKNKQENNDNGYDELKTSSITNRNPNGKGNNVKELNIPKFNNVNEVRSMRVNNCKYKHLLSFANIKQFEKNCKNIKNTKNNCNQFEAHMESTENCNDDGSTAKPAVYAAHDEKRRGKRPKKKPDFRRLNPFTMEFTDYYLHPPQDNDDGDSDGNSNSNNNNNTYNNNNDNSNNSNGNSNHNGHNNCNCNDNYNNDRESRIERYNCQCNELLLRGLNNQNGRVENINIIHVYGKIVDSDICSHNIKSSTAENSTTTITSSSNCHTTDISEHKLQMPNQQIEHHPVSDSDIRHGLNENNRQRHRRDKYRDNDQHHNDYGNPHEQHHYSDQRQRNRRDDRYSSHSGDDMRDGRSDSRQRSRNR